MMPCIPPRPIKLHQLDSGLRIDMDSRGRNSPLKSRTVLLFVLLHVDFDGFRKVRSQNSSGWAWLGWYLQLSRPASGAIASAMYGVASSPVWTITRLAASSTERPGRTFLITSHPCPSQSTQTCTVSGHAVVWIHAIALLIAVVSILGCLASVGAEPPLPPTGAMAATQNVIAWLVNDMVAAFTEITLRARADCMWWWWWWWWWWDGIAIYLTFVACYVIGAQAGTCSL